MSSSAGSTGSNQAGAAVPPSQRRLNRPKDKDALLLQLTDKGPFGEYRDVLVFAAALGWHEQRRIPLAAKGEPIRWDTAIHRRGTEALTNMIAAAESGDPEIVAPDRFEDRLQIFEEYANGGLETLRAMLENEPRAPTDVIIELIQKVCRTEDQPDSLDITFGADGLQW